LAPPQFSPEKLNSFQEKIISYIHEGKGVLIKTGSLSKKRGDFTLFNLNFQLDPAEIESFEKKIKTDEPVRCMILAKAPTTLREATTKPAAVFRKKGAIGKVELKEIEKKLEEILGE
jgi:hypothetical protein